MDQATPRRVLTPGTSTYLCAHAYIRAACARARPRGSKGVSLKRCTSAPNGTEILIDFALPKLLRDNHAAIFTDTFGAGAVAYRVYLVPTPDILVRIPVDDVPEAGRDSEFNGVVLTGACLPLRFEVDPDDLWIVLPDFYADGNHYSCRLINSTFEQNPYEENGY